MECVAKYTDLMQVQLYHKILFQEHDWTHNIVVIGTDCILISTCRCKLPSIQSHENKTYIHMMSSKMIMYNINIISCFTWFLFPRIITIIFIYFRLSFHSLVCLLKTFISQMKVILASKYYFVLSNVIKKKKQQHTNNLCKLVLWFQCSHILL